MAEGTDGHARPIKVNDYEMLPVGHYPPRAHLNGLHALPMADRKLTGRSADFSAVDEVDVPAPQPAATGMHLIREVVHGMFLL